MSKKNVNLEMEDLTEDMHKKYTSDREMEHQIGRLLHMKQIMQEIVDKDIPGDIIEYGVYEGFSLMWLAKLRDYFSLNNRKIIGIDSFEGLPISSGPWAKGTFKDTSEEVVIENLEGLDNIVIIKSWFNNSELPAKIATETDTISIFHVDCDLGQSAEEAFTLMEPYLKDEQFLLFDDWGIDENEIPIKYKMWKRNHPDIKQELHSETAITKYFKIYS